MNVQPALVDGTREAAVARWTNYHFTHTIDVVDHRRFDEDGKMSPAAATTGPDMLATSAALLKMHAGDADRLGTRCGIIGKAWSFSRLTGNASLQLECGGKLAWETGLQDRSGLVGTVPVSPEELHVDAKLAAATLAWTRGGTTMRELAVWAEGRGLSLITSGDQLGPSLAGAAATGTHGSRLGYGAVQNMVRGLHLITGPSESVWIEPAIEPVLAEPVAHSIADRVIRDDSLFSDAVMHLGALGIVNGAIVELETKRLFDKVVPILRLERIWDDWIAAVLKQDFAQVAHLLGHDGTPIFYEFSLNPFDPKGEESVHILYFPSHSLVGNEGFGRTPRPSDAVYCLPEHLHDQAPLAFASNIDLPRLYVTLVRSDLEQHPDQKALPWSRLHDKDEETGARGALFNAGFAVPLARLEDAISTMCSSVTTLSNDRQFIFTYRFVTKAAGRLTHLRWDDSVAIELDGASELFAARYQVTPNSPVGLQMVQRAFDGAGIDYCMHWGKLGNSAKLVAKNLGGVGSKGSPIDFWHQSRKVLLPTAAGQRTMQNDLVVEYGLV